MRYFDYRRKIKVFDRCFDRARRSRYRRLFPEVRKQPVELPHLAIRSPAKVAIAGVPQIYPRYLLESLRCIEASGEFVGERLILDKAVFARRPYGLLIKAHRRQFPPLQ